MRVIIHDLDDFKPVGEKLEDKTITVISAKEKAAYCKGCFGCWLKKPGSCIMADRLQDVGSKVIQAEELIIISKCTYGGYSSHIKKVIDRCIPGVMPFFIKKNGEMHHAARYENEMKLTVLYYNQVSDKEKNLSHDLAKANGLNFWAREHSVTFTDKSSIAEKINTNESEVTA